jgi:hypothetical protein
MKAVTRSGGWCRRLSHLWSSPGLTPGSTVLAAGATEHHELSPASRWVFNGPLASFCSLVCVTYRATAPLSSSAFPASAIVPRCLL